MNEWLWSFQTIGLLEYLLIVNLFLNIILINKN